MVFDVPTKGRNNKMILHRGGRNLFWCFNEDADETFSHWELAMGLLGPNLHDDDVLFGAILNGENLVFTHLPTLPEWAVPRLLELGMGRLRFNGDDVDLEGA
jgi:hypothetical protein